MSDQYPMLHESGEEDQGHTGSKILINVRVIRTEKKSALVEYTDPDSGELKRVSVETRHIKDGQCTASALQKGILYGVDWSALETVSITPAIIAEVLHKYNLWTAQDVRGNPITLRSAVQEMNGKLLKLIMQFIKDK